MARPQLLALLLLIATAVTDAASPGWAEVEFPQPAGTDVSGAPEACSADLIASIGWGVATAAYQIEGAHREGGKGPSIWDQFVTQQGRIRGGATGDVACDYYHRYKEDIALMKQLGVKMHRFSIAWTRIFPKGRGDVNARGVAFYNDVINEMLAAGITPVATIYHWDLPQALQDEYGGFLSDRIVDDYNAYAATLFKLYGDRVKNWITFNEPPMICEGYNQAKFAPGLGGGRKYYLGACHNLLRAHAKAVGTYRSQFADQGGKIGLTTYTVWAEPLSDSPEDKLAAQNKLDREFGWLLDPVILGDYPASMKAAVGADLPAFSEEERAAIKGSVDFVGVNCYTSRWVFKHPDNSWGFKQTAQRDGKDIGFKTNEWLYATPGALGALLTYVGQRYNKIETWVTEFGTNVKDENLMSVEQALDDSYRIQYYHAYLSSACAAIRDFGLNVKHLFAWTFMDNLEWVEGYEVPYGLVHVNFKDGSLARTPKRSAAWFTRNFFSRSDVRS